MDILQFICSVDSLRIISNLNLVKTPRATVVIKKVKNSFFSSSDVCYSLLFIVIKWEVSHLISNFFFKLLELII